MLPVRVTLDKDAVSRRALVLLSPVGLRRPLRIPLSPLHRSEQACCRGPPRLRPAAGARPRTFTAPSVARAVAPALSAIRWLGQPTRVTTSDVHGHAGQRTPDRVVLAPTRTIYVHHPGKPAPDGMRLQSAAAGAADADENWRFTATSAFAVR